MSNPDNGDDVIGMIEPLVADAVTAMHISDLGLIAEPGTGAMDRIGRF